MKILISGSSGLLGSQLVPYLTKAGHSVGRLVRSANQMKEGDVLWSVTKGKIDRKHLEGFNAVIHLAGESIYALRWTKKKKACIRESRVNGTHLLAEALAGLNQPPSVFLSASAVGFYGNRGNEWMEENASRGDGFLAHVCEEWEKATEPARQKGIRVVQTRFGIILSPQGGALGTMLPIFKAGLGGPLGKGHQYFSWIALDDVLDALLFIISKESLTGPVNVATPEPITNLEFTRTLGKTLHRPTFAKVPAVVLKALMGEMAEEMFLVSTRVKPKKLMEAGFKFRYPEVGHALKHMLGR